MYDYFKHTPRFLSRRVKYDDRYGGTATETARVKLPVGWTLDDLRAWARECFDTYCQHEHDCCGHWYRALYTHDAKRVKSRTYIVRIRHSQNI